MEKRSIKTSKQKFHTIKRITKSPTFGVFLILLILIVIMTIVAGDIFLTRTNLLSVFRQISFTAIVAIGISLVIITGGIDLSVGAVYGFAGVCAAIAMTQWQWGVIPGVMFGLLIAAVCGSINGVLVTKMDFPPFIATLGMMGAARGVSLGITEAVPIFGMPASYVAMGQGFTWGIPNPILIMLGIGIIFTFFLRKLVIGRQIYAIGGNEEAARVSGIDTNKVKMTAYILCAVIAGFAGILTAARLGTAQPAAGRGLELDAIAAAIIGGASLKGGVGNIAGPIMGAAIMGILNNAITLLAISPNWREAIIGVVIILAIMMDRFRASKQSK